MYHFIRRTHLFTALILFLFVLLYAVSGYVLELPKDFPLSPGATITRTEAFHDPGLPASSNGAPADLTDYIKQTYDLHGKPRPMRVDNKTGARYFFYMGSKGIYNVTLARDASQITISTAPYGFYGALNRLHHLEGFDGGPIYAIWGVMFDLVCIAMILFSLSGIYLWYRLTKRRALGWVLLTISVGYTVATAAYCICAR